VLTAYAALGFILLAYADHRPAALLRSAKRWWIAALLVVALWGASSIWLDSLVQEGIDVRAIPELNLEAYALYSAGSWSEQVPFRISDYLMVQFSIALAAVPQIVALFLTGYLAGRLGWLAHPRRHPRLWRNAARLGWLALPFAAAGGWLIWRTVLETPGTPNYLGYALQLPGSALLLLYLALLLRVSARAPVARVLTWLAPAGRMPLTNYLSQSVLMGVLLSGWGLGWGASASHAQLALLALAIVLVQWTASRLWLAHFAQGPVEAVWRRLAA
jgi:uncharacterized protein